MIIEDLKLIVKDYEILWSTIEWDLVVEIIETIALAFNQLVFQLIMIGCTCTHVV